MSEIKHTLREANIARQAEWDKDARISLSYRGNEMAGEVGEACNVIKKLERERLGIAGSRATLDQLAEELADVVICADLIAMGEGIDLLGEAVPKKFNATSIKVGMLTRLSAAELSAKDAEILRLHEEVNRQDAENARLREALTDLVEDLEMRARNGVVDCSDGVYHRARAALQPTSRSAQ